MPTKGKDGFYHSKVVPAPGVKPVYFRARTLREFNQRRQQIIQDYRTGRSGKNMAFVDLALEWWNVIRLPGVKASTAATQRSYLKVHILDVFPPQQLARAVRYKDLQQCVDRMAGMSKSYVNQIIGMLKGICRYGLSQDAMDADYSTALRLPRVAKSEQRSALTADQAAAVRSALSSDPVGIALALQYYCGLRCGESLALRWGDVNFSAARLHVVVQYNKTTRTITDLKNEQSERYVDMPDDLVALLYPLRGLPGIYVCTGSLQPYTYGAFKYHFVRLLLRLGFAHPNENYEKARDKKHKTTGQLSVPFNPNYYTCDFTPHNLRHNYATALYRNQVVPEFAMKLLGHKSYDTTMRIYTDIKNMLDDAVSLDPYLPPALEKVANKLQSRRIGAF